MKKAVTLCVLVLMVCIQTPLGQLFKLPLLVEHYIKHQKQDGVSLVGFLEGHYASNHQDEDLPEDEQLPFKNVLLYSIGYAILTPLVPVTVFAPLPTEKKIDFAHTYSPQQHLACIFHPPKV